MCSSVVLTLAHRKKMKVGFGPKTVRNGKGLPAEVSIDLVRSVTRKRMRKVY